MPEMKPTSSVKASNRPMTAGVASTRMSMVVLSKRPVIGANANASDTATSREMKQSVELSIISRRMMCLRFAPKRRRAAISRAR